MHVNDMLLEHACAQKSTTSCIANLTGSGMKLGDGIKSKNKTQKGRGILSVLSVTETEVVPYGIMEY